MKEFLNRILKALGLAKAPPPPPPPPTKLELLDQKLQSSKPEEKAELVKQFKSEAESQITKLTESLPAETTSKAPEIPESIKQILQEYEVVLHFSSIDKTVNEESNLVLLQNFSKLLAKLSVDSESFLKNYETYIQKYQEELLFSEARGEYKYKLSENKAWIKLPLTTDSTKNPKLDKTKLTELSKIFFEIPILKHMELDEKIPMLPTSFIDVKQLISDKRVVPVFYPDKHEYFLMIV